MNSVTDQISVERVVALLTAASPVLLVGFEHFQKLPWQVQVAVILVIGLAGYKWLDGRAKWTTTKLAFEEQPPRPKTK